MNKKSNLLAIVAVTALLIFPASASAQTLGRAANFAVLGASTVTSTGPSIVNGDLGLYPGSSVTGFPPGVLNGTLHINDSAAINAQADVSQLYSDLTALPCGTDLTGQDLGTMVLTPGVYCFSSSAQLTGVLTLNLQNDPNALFVFKIGSTLTTASNASVVMINSGQTICPGNVYWRVGSSATLGTGSSVLGNIVANSSITLTTGANLTGRALAMTGAVTLDTNNVSATQCATTPAPAIPALSPALLVLLAGVLGAAALLFLRR